MRGRMFFGITFVGIVAGVLALGAMARAEPSGQEAAVIMQQEMVRAMAQAQVEAKTATRLASQNRFLAEAVLEGALEQERLRLGPEADPAKLQQRTRSRAQQVGSQVGAALASGVRAYGEGNALQVMAMVMSSVRAGMNAEAASGMAAALADGGYALRDMRMVMQRTMERVRAETPEDAGTSLALQVRTMAQARTMTQAMLGALDGNGPGRSAGNGQGGTQGGQGTNSGGTSSGGSGSGSGSGGSSGGNGSGSSGSGGGSGGNGSGSGKGGK